MNLRTAWNEFKALDRETADQQTSNKCHAAACEAYSLGQRTSYVLHVDIHIYMYIYLEALRASPATVRSVPFQTACSVLLVSVSLEGVPEVTRNMTR